MIRRIPADAAIACSGIVAALLVALHWTLPGFVISHGDVTWGAARLNFLIKNLFVWNTYASPGGTYGFNLMLWPHAAVAGLLAAIAGESSGQMLTLGVLLGAGWALAYLALRALGFGKLASAVGAGVYACNPWTRAMLVASVPAVWCFATAPAFIALVAIAAHQPGRRRAARLGIALLAAIPLAVVATDPAQIAVLMLVVWLGCRFAVQTFSPDRDFRRWLCGTLAIAAFAALWWMVPYAVAMLAGSFAMPEPVVFAFAPRGAATFAATVALLSLSVLSLQLRTPARAGITRTAFGAVFAVFVLCYAIFKAPDWISAFAVRSPIGFLWNEPAATLPVLALCGLAIGAAAVIERAKGPRHPAIAAVAVAFALVVADGAAFAGSPFEGPLSVVPSGTVPAYWLTAARWLNDAPGRDAAVVLPSSQQAGSIWNADRTALVPSDLLHRQTISLRAVANERSDQDNGIYDLLNQALDDSAIDLGAVMRDVGVRYVVFRGDLTQSRSQVPLTVVDVRRRLPGVPETHFGPLSVFDLGPARSPVETGRSWIAGDYGAAPNGLTLDTQLERAPRIDVREFGDSVPDTGPAAYEVVGAQSNSAFPGSDLARAAVADVPLRYLWWAPMRKFSAVFGGRVALHAVMRQREVSFSRATITVPGTFLGSARISRTKVLLSVVSGPQPADDGGTVWFVVNPADRYVTAKVDVSVPGRGPSAHVLSVNRLAYRDTVANAVTNVWVSFAPVIFSPGINAVHLGSLPAASGSRVAVATDDVPGELRVRGADQIPGTQGNGLGLPGGVHVASPTTYHVRFASLLLGLPLRARPTLSVGFNPSPVPLTLGAIENFEFEGVAYSCFSPISHNVDFEVRVAVSGCLHTAGIDPGRSDVDSAFLRSVDFDAMLPLGVTAATARPGIVSVYATWLENGVDAEAFTDFSAIAQGADTVRLTPAGDAYVYFGEPKYRRVSLTNGKPLGDLIGADVEVKSPAGRVRGTLTSDSGDSLSVFTADGASVAVRRSTIASLTVLPSQPGVTLRFNTAAVPSNDPIAFRPLGATVVGAWLGHVEGIGDRFVPDADVAWTYKYGTVGGLAIRPSDLANSPTPYPRAIRLAIDLATSAGGALGINARVSNPAAGTVTVSRGGRSYDLARDGIYDIPAPSRGPTVVDVDDRSGRTLAAAIGQPFASAPPQRASLFNGIPLLGIVGSASSALELRQAFSPAWTALCFGRCPLFVPHYRDESGWNLWWISGSGTVVIANLAVVLQCLVACVSVGVLLASLRMARSELRR